MRGYLFNFILISCMFLMIGCNSTDVENDEDVLYIDGEGTKSDGSENIIDLDQGEGTEGNEISGDLPNTEINSTTVEEKDFIKNIMLPNPETEYVTEEMLHTGIIGEANLSRLASAMRKASRGEAITVGVIGGSITQGSSTTSAELSYAEGFRRWWEQAFPNAAIQFVNAGIGATTSYLGVHRVDQDLLKFQPDVVVVEFSVNDSSTLFFKRTYEDLIRKILMSENNPAVISLFMTMEDGTSAKKNHGNIAFIYQLPRINYGDVVLAEIQKGTFTWKDISPDNIHPNDMGHAIVSELLWNYLNSVYEKINTIVEAVKEMDTKPFGDLAYIDGRIYDNSTITPIEMGSYEKGSGVWKFPNNWVTSTGEDSIVFEVEAKNIGIMFYRMINGLSGQFEVYVDGEYCRTLDANFNKGWGNYTETIEVFRSDEKKIRTIEIKKSEDSSGNEFNLLGLMIS